MNALLIECPTCKGKGTVTVEAVTIDERGTTKEPPLEIKCLTCRGEGRITKKRSAQLKRAAALWCSCGNPSGDVYFHDDGECPDCRKHHYHCSDCGKIVQVG